MRVYIQIKQLGKRKCSIEKIPIDFPVPPVNAGDRRLHRQLAKSPNTTNACNRAKC